MANNEIKDYLFRSLEEASSYQLKEANSIGYRFSEFLFKAAFGVIGFGALRIVGTIGTELSKSNLSDIGLGLVLLGFSIVCGGIQMVQEVFFFREHGFLTGNVAFLMKLAIVEPNDHDIDVRLKHELKKLDLLPQVTNDNFIYLQSILLILGTLLQILDLFS